MDEDAKFACPSCSGHWRVLLTERTNYEEPEYCPFCGYCPSSHLTLQRFTKISSRMVSNS